VATISHETTRRSLHRVAAHVLGRRRFEVSGHFGLRASPGGVATPAFGEEPEAIRLSGVWLVRELGGLSAVTTVSGATLRDLVGFAGADVDAPFSAGEATPPLGDVDAPIELDASATGAIAQWFGLGWRVLDEVLASLPASAEPATTQLWPEHFDAATHVGLSSGTRVNLGFSAGDDFEPEPYLYVGPWTPERPGDPEYWNAPFGALMRSSDIGAGADAGRRCVDFLLAGLANASHTA